MLLLRRERSYANNVPLNPRGLKELRAVKTDDDKSEANVIQNFEDEDLYLTTTKEVVKSKWVINYVILQHILEME